MDYLVECSGGPDHIEFCTNLHKKMLSFSLFFVPYHAYLVIGESVLKLSLQSCIDRLSMSFSFCARLTVFGDKDERTHPTTVIKNLSFLKGHHLRHDQSMIVIQNQLKLIVPLM